MPSYVRAGIRKCARIRALSLVKQTHTKLNPLDEYALCNKWVGRKNERTYYGNESCKKR